MMQEKVLSVVKKMSDSEIIKSAMRIIKFDRNGIIINAIGMSKPNILKFDRYGKEPQQTKPQQTKPQQPQSTRISINKNKSGTLRV